MGSLVRPWVVGGNSFSADWIRPGVVVGQIKSKPGTSRGGWWALTQKTGMFTGCWYRLTQFCRLDAIGTI